MPHTAAELAKWPEKIPGRCNFRKRDHTRCKKHPVTGTDRCRTHKRASGPDAPNWKGGISKGWARKFLPQRLLARYDAVVNSPDLTSVRQLIGIVGARITELSEKISTRESNLAWENFGLMLAQLEEFGHKQKGKNKEDLDRIVGAMRADYGHAMHERLAWQELMDTMERARKLIETENKREAFQEANLTAKQGIALFNAIFLILSEELKEHPDLRARVGLRLQTLATGPKVLGPGAAA